jgi:ParB family chromosome partitioning protein
LELADIPDDLADLIDDDITTDSDIIHSLKLISELSPVLYRELLVQARNTEEGGISRGIVRDALKLAKGQIPPTVLPSSGFNNQAGQSGAQKSGTDDAKNTAGPLNGQQQVTESQTPVATENISHAKTSDPQNAAGDNAQNNGSDSSTLDGKSPVVPSAGPASQPKAKDAKEKIGKNETVSIRPDQLVIGVAVCFASKILHGELLTDRVLGDSSKAWVNVMDGGKQLTKLVALDDITITSMAALAPLT